jgi:hypothetical protein
LYIVAPVEGQDMSRPALNRSQSRAFLSEDGLPQPIEYFLASDASAIVEHTKRVLYMEDDDIAHIADGGKIFFFTTSFFFSFFLLTLKKNPIFRTPHPSCPSLQGRHLSCYSFHSNLGNRTC